MSGVSPDRDRPSRGRPVPSCECPPSRPDQSRSRRLIAVSPGGEDSSMKIKSFAGLFAALLFAFAAIGCSSNNATPVPAADSPAVAASPPPPSVSSRSLGHLQPTGRSELSSGRSRFVAQPSRVVRVVNAAERLVTVRRQPTCTQGAGADQVRERLAGLTHADYHVATLERPRSRGLVRERGAWTARRPVPALRRIRAAGLRSGPDGGAQTAWARG